jgi:hypothetical protein
MIPPFVAGLLSQGLGLLANAAVAKGKDWVLDKTGVDLREPLSTQDLTKLKQYELEHEEELLKIRLEEKKLGLEELKIASDLIKNEDNNVSTRWQTDMSSDSWLSKNIRPLSLIAIFAGYFLFSMMSAFGYNANEAYVSLLGQWGIIVFGAYFGSRCVEKLAQIRSDK